ncbi:hypothetical protein PHMEG_00014800 [Phytophthora megakarya]|uniref:RxLR effector protein n=1 Tax=Phytophthora megakarya TaxID=4795 RepID=A0A225W2V6_9STRA|nr:hypothetical protein PHMEG_00014800 [Phytophthora megakarya]
MHIIQVVFVFLLVLFTSCESTTAPTKHQLTISTTNATATAKALEKFFTEDAKQNKNNGFLKVVTPTSSGEERASTSAITAGEGARAGTGATVVSSDTPSGEMVTVTVYNNNGLWQRFERWWNRLFYTSSSRLLRPS